MLQVDEKQAFTSLGFPCKRGEGTYRRAWEGTEGDGTGGEVTVEEGIRET